MKNPFDSDKIKVFAIDVDGTLTNGIYYVSTDGIMKAFHTLDFYAIEKLCDNGIRVLIITQSDDGIIDEKMAGLNSRNWDLLTGSKNKKEDLQFWLDENEMKWDNIAYIGDADNDLSCIAAADVSACPASAIAAVRAMVSYCSCKNGGEGAVYDIVQLFLSYRQG